MKHSIPNMMSVWDFLYLYEAYYGRPCCKISRIKK